MTYDELMRLLIERQALIVHCSRPGKNADEQRYGNLSGDDLLFPGDLRNAIDAVAGTGELSCSVIWPGHLKTYGCGGHRAAAPLDGCDPVDQPDRRGLEVGRSNSSKDRRRRALLRTRGGRDHGQHH